MMRFLLAVSPIHLPVLLLSIFIGPLSFAQDVVSAVGKSSLTCPANLECVLSFSDANTLLVQARHSVLADFLAKCSAPGMTAQGPYFRNEVVSCSQSGRVASCTILATSVCTLEAEYSM